MAQLDGTQQNGGSSRTMEQLFASETPLRWNPSWQEEDVFSPGKKLSVLARVKEKARRWRQTLVRKRQGQDANHTPWGVALEDYEVEDDSDSRRAPRHESQYASRNSCDNARYQTTWNSGTSRRRVSGSRVNIHSDRIEKDRPFSLRRRSTGPNLTRSRSFNQNGSSSTPRRMLNDSHRAKSFRFSRDNHHVPIDITSEFLSILKSADKLKEKVPSDKISTQRFEADDNVNKDIVEHPNYRRTTAENVIAKRIEYEGKEKTNHTKKANEGREDQPHRKAHPNIKLITRYEEQEVPLSSMLADQEKEKPPCTHSPMKVDRKTSTGNLIDESTGYEEEHNQLSPRKADQGRVQPSHSLRKAGQESKNPPLSPRKTNEERDTYSAIKTKEIRGTQIKNAGKEEEFISPTTIEALTEAMSEKLGPAYATMSEATQKMTSRIQGLSIEGLQGNMEERKWDKGVSVKAYFKNKLEPGEDERALSQVISEVISPRRSPSEKGVLEKLKMAVTLLLQSEETPASSSLKTSEVSSSIPVSTNAHEVVEENQGRILQAN